MSKSVNKCPVFESSDSGTQSYERGRQVFALCTKVLVGVVLLSVFRPIGTLAYSHPLKECITTYQQGTQHCSLHSLPHTRQPICAMFSSNKSSHLNMLYKHSTAHGLHSFCIQGRPRLPCSVAIKLQPPQHDINIHYAPMQHYTHPTAFHNPPICTNNKHKA